MHEAVAAIAATGVSPVVRIAANESWMVKRMYPFSRRIHLSPRSHAGGVIVNSKNRCLGRRSPRNSCPSPPHRRRCKETSGIGQVSSLGQKRVWKPIFHGLIWESYSNGLFASGKWGLGYNCSNRNQGGFWKCEVCRYFFNQSLNHPLTVFKRLASWLG